MNFDDMSLEELIESQRKDMRMRNRVPRQRGEISLDLETTKGYAVSSIFLSNEGYLGAKMDRRRGLGACTLHGYKNMAPSGKCSECSRIRQWDKRRAAGKPLRRKYECNHGEEFVVYWGKNKQRYCRECMRLRRRESYLRNRDSILEKKRQQRIDEGKKPRPKAQSKPKPKLPDGVKVLEWFDE